MSKYRKEDIFRIVEEEDVEFIRLQFTDIFGMLKNVAITSSQLKKALDNRCMFDGSSIEGFVRIEESDMYLYPDLDTFEIFPWRPQQGKVARLMCDVYRPDKTPFEGDPRYVLRRVLKEASDMGFVYQMLFLFPYVLAPVTNVAVWQNIIYNPIFGLVGYLNRQGFHIPSLLSDMKTALYAVAATDIWHYWGFLMVVYLASLRQTPEDQVEAARVEGCSGWQLFRYVYFPNMLPTFKLMMIMSVINSFLTYDYVYLMTSGGPAHSTEMLSTYAYTFAFASLQVGKAAAIALFMSFFGLIASFVYIHLSQNEIMS